jgi:enoyl-CoA hydratase/carnithine racemase
MAELVLRHSEGKVGVVTLNRPEKLNALSMQMRLDLQRTLEEADEDPDTTVIVLKANGRSFCVGFDVGGHATPQPWRHDALRYHQRLSISMRALSTPWRLRKPVIASVQGHALGGGCELSLFCDVTIAADDALFGEPEILFSQVGPAIIMSLTIGHKRARELIYLGEKVNAATALNLGIVNRVVPAAELEEATMKYAKRMTLIAPEALAAAKLAISRGAEAQGFNNALNTGVDIFAPLYAATTEVGRQFEEIRAKDGLKAALQWRKRQFDE